MNLGANSMSLTTSNASWKSGDGVSDQFPAGMRVLVVDDNLICLRLLERMLRNCHYEVTKCSRAEVALKLLRDNRDGFDIVISEVHMPDMDGFKLLEHIGLEMDLPVIMLSADDSKHVVMKGVTHGACDYLIKPVRMEALKNIWQHVVRKKKHEWKEKDLEQSGRVADGDGFPPRAHRDRAESSTQGGRRSTSHEVMDDLHTWQDGMSQRMRQVEADIQVMRGDVTFLRNAQFEQRQAQIEQTEMLRLMHQWHISQGHYPPPPP